MVLYFWKINVSNNQFIPTKIFTFYISIIFYLYSALHQGRKQMQFWMTRPVGETHHQKTDEALNIFFTTICLFYLYIQYHFIA